MRTNERFERKGIPREQKREKNSAPEQRAERGNVEFSRVDPFNARSKQHTNGR